MSIRDIRLPQEDKDHLIRLKSRTGIGQWNILSRCALTISLQEPSPISLVDLPVDSNLEMTWEVFGGEYGDLYDALLRERALADGFSADPESLNKQARLHIHRGIGYLTTPGRIRSIRDLCRDLVPASASPSSSKSGSPSDRGSVSQKPSGRTNKKQAGGSRGRRHRPGKNSSRS